MEFTLDKAIEILSGTADTLDALLAGLSDAWLRKNEGEETWSPYDVLGHLIHGEKTDWMIRTNIILSETPDKTFIPFDRFAQFENDQKVSIEILIEEFRRLRKANLSELKALDLDEQDLEKEGIHPDLGKVSLKQLISTWVVHDLGHIAQISRVMAKQYAEEVGPWKAYLRILE